MGVVDLIVTPFYLLILWLYAYIHRARVKDDVLTQSYFVSAFFLRILGGIAFAAVYAFYYKGGDTLNYYQDSLLINDALWNSPSVGFKLLFFKPDLTDPDFYHYLQKSIFKTDSASHFVSALAAFFNLFTFESFFGTTILFSLIGFWGNWQLFKTLCKLFPDMHKHLAIGCLYLPSILFWTSGLMKDTLCTAALCFLFKSIVDFLIFRKRGIIKLFMILSTVWILYLLKIYILLCFIPTVSIYIFSIINNKIRNVFLRKIIKPFFYIAAGLTAYFSIDFISKDNKKYNLDALQETAQITAQYIGAVSIKTGGSFYSLGELDFSLSNIPLLTVKAFNVTFYRPYIWEITSPLMIFSVIESLYLTYLSYLFLMHVIRVKKFRKVFTPFTSFCFSFAIVFSFVVGTTSNNFGTLARYKSLMLPFFICGIYATIKNKNESSPSRATPVTYLTNAPLKP